MTSDFSWPHSWFAHWRFECHLLHPLRSPADTHLSTVWVNRSPVLPMDWWFASNSKKHHSADSRATRSDKPMPNRGPPQWPGDSVATVPMHIWSVSAQCSESHPNCIGSLAAGFVWIPVSPMQPPDLQSIASVRPWRSLKVHRARHHSGLRSNLVDLLPMFDSPAAALAQFDDPFDFAPENDRQPIEWHFTSTVIVKHLQQLSNCKRRWGALRSAISSSPIHQ